MTNDLDIIAPDFTLTSTWNSPAINGGGIVVTASNGLGVSIVRHDGSYGGKSGLFEAMVIDTDGNLFGEPAGWLTKDEVLAFCAEVASR